MQYLFRPLPLFFANTERQPRCVSTDIDSRARTYRQSGWSCLCSPSAQNLPWKSVYLNSLRDCTVSEVIRYTDFDKGLRAMFQCLVVPLIFCMCTWRCELVCDLLRTEGFLSVGAMQSGALSVPCKRARAHVPAPCFRVPRQTASLFASSKHPVFNGTLPHASIPCWNNSLVGQ